MAKRRWWNTGRTMKWGGKKHSSWLDGASGRGRELNEKADEKWKNNTKNKQENESKCTRKPNEDTEIYQQEAANHPTTLKLLLHNLLYKLCIKERRSPRWINDLHSRFIVRAKMKYFFLLPRFNMFQVERSPLVFSTYLSVLDLFASPQIQCCVCGAPVLHSTRSPLARILFLLLLLLSVWWWCGVAIWDGETSRNLLWLPERVGYVFKWSMKMPFLRFHYKCFAACWSKWNVGSFCCKYNIVISVRNADMK